MGNYIIKLCSQDVFILKGVKVLFYNGHK